MMRILVNDINGKVSLLHHDVDDLTMRHVFGIAEAFH